MLTAIEISADEADLFSDSSEAKQRKRFHSRFFIFTKKIKFKKIGGRIGRRFALRALPQVLR